MYLNLLVLFICVNFAVGLVTGVEGSPLHVGDMGTDECHPFPLYGIDNDPASPTYGEMVPIAPEVDPVIGRGITGLNDMTEVEAEMRHPTNSTDSDPSWLGDGNPFNAISEAASRGWKGMETMMNIVTGGYIMDIIEHTTLNCQLDSKAFLTTQAECDLQAPPHNVAPCENATYGMWIDPLNCDDPATPNVIERDCNPMWNTFKGGVQVIFGMLLVITIFYWITGRGHMLSS